MEPAGQRRTRVAGIVSAENQAALSPDGARLLRLLDHPDGPAQWNVELDDTATGRSAHRWALSFAPEEVWFEQVFSSDLPAEGVGRASASHQVVRVGDQCRVVDRQSGTSIDVQSELCRTDERPIGEKDDR